MSIESHDDVSIAWCQSHVPPITYESYFTMKGCPFNNAKVKAIAAAHAKSVSQVCLRWVLERGGILAVGTGANATTAKAYAKENLDIYGFSLTAADMATLNGIQA
jgi:diketogulonate reductase-like aldo/keto reductase